VSAGAFGDYTGPMVVRSFSIPRPGNPASALPPKSERENSTSAEFCLILPDQGAPELLRGECGRGSSASYSRSPYLLDASIAQSRSAFVCAWDVVADEN
jgi:hypothetical protein